MSELTHYGVKGMRWGVRRKRPTTYAERRARTKRALKIAGAIAGGAALGYIGYRNRGAIANYSANRFADARRFARSNATRAGMTARAYGSMAAQGARSGYGYVRNVSSNRMEDARRSARRNLTKAGMIARDAGARYADFGRAVGAYSRQEFNKSRVGRSISARRQERDAVQARRERRETAYKIHRHANAPQRLRNEHSKANIDFLRRKSGGAGRGAVNSPDSARMSFDKAVANHLIVSGRFKADPRRSFASQVADHRHRFAPTRMRYEAKNNTRFVGPKSGSSKPRRKNRGIYGSYK